MIIGFQGEMFMQVSICANEEENAAQRCFYYEYCNIMCGSVYVFEPTCVNKETGAGIARVLLLWIW
jgi:hypothetical protein